jgi:hypothetical protein
MEFKVPECSMDTGKFRKRLLLGKVRESGFKRQTECS